MIYRAQHTMKRGPIYLTRSHRRGVEGFTIVELLVVIGIIAVLIALLLPTLTRARQQAKTVQCQANLRTVGQMLRMYENENKGWLFPVGPDDIFGKPTTFGTNYT